MKADKKIDPEKVFRAALDQEGIPQPDAEWIFAAPRKWRFDYAWIAVRVALEVEGAIWTQGRHTRGSGFLKDMEKYNAAASRGWLVLRCTPDGLCLKENLATLKRTIKLREAA